MYSNNKREHDAYPKCGEIWMCNLTSKDGSVQGGYRPVFILSNDKNNLHSSTLNIIPLTSKMNKRNLPIHVELWDYWKYGLKMPSTMMIEQITTVPALSLDVYIGLINNKQVLENILKAMSIQFPVGQLLNDSVC